MYVRVYVCVCELEVCTARFFRPGPGPARPELISFLPARGQGRVRALGQADRADLYFELSRLHTLMMFLNV